jgi:hypothetical protein
LGVVFGLLLLILGLYFILSKKDSIDGLSRKHKVDKNYDMGQNLIIEYTKKGFHKTYSLPKLFLFMVKVINKIFNI